jgi:hypothetical protein
MLCIRAVLTLLHAFLSPGRRGQEGMLDMWAHLFSFARCLPRLLKEKHLYGYSTCTNHYSYMLDTLVQCIKEKYCTICQAVISSSTFSSRSPTSDLTAG